MNEISLSLGIALLLHCFFALLIFLSVLAIVVWIFKFAKKDELTNFIWACLVPALFGMALVSLWKGNEMRELWWQTNDSRYEDRWEDNGEEMVEQMEEMMDIDQE